MSVEHFWGVGSLDLVTTSGAPASGFWFETMADGFDLGRPEGARVVLRSLLLDGDDETIDRFGNRSVLCTIKVRGYTWAEVQAGERALANEMHRRNSLTWRPPDGTGATTLFDVRTSEMTLVVDDMEWIGDGVKTATYQVEFRCSPWGLAAQKVTETFTTATGTVTTIDNCTSAAAWPGLTAGTFMSQSVVSTAQRSGSFEERVTRTGNIAAAAYVYVDAYVEGSVAGLVKFVLTGEGAGPTRNKVVAAIPQATGFTRYFFRWFPSARPLSFQFSLGTPNDGGSARVHFDQVGTSTTIPSTSLMSLTMRGSVRVQGQLQISNPGGGSVTLGEVFAYTDPTMLDYGWSPGMPSSWAQAPDGEYVAWINATGTVPGDVFAVTILGGATARTRVAAGQVWVPIGPFHLGGARSRRIGIPAPGGTGATAFEVRRNGTVLSSGLDVMIFREGDDTALMYVSGLGDSSSRNRHLFVDPPNFDQLLPGIFSGAAADGSDARSVLDRTKSWGWPLLVPPITGLFVRSSATANPDVKVVSRPAFHTFATDAEG